MKVVLDTNVLVSGLLNPGGIPAKIINLLFLERIEIAYDNRILNEYEDVLKRVQFGFSDEQVTPLIDYIKHSGEYVTAEPFLDKFGDEDDKKFYEVYKSSQAAHLITGNKAHFPKEKGIVSPKEFLLSL